MLDQLTPETPRLAFRANDLTWVWEVSFSSEGRPQSHRYRLANEANWYASNSREFDSNVRTGHWMPLYLCTETGARLVPLTEEEWHAVCNKLRDARIADSAAAEAVNAASKSLDDAQAAKKATAKAVTDAQQQFNSCI